MKEIKVKQLGAVIAVATLNLFSTACAQGAGYNLLTITNPAPAVNYHFGDSVAALGTDRVLIGANGSDGGEVFLFSTSGALLTTFTNPAPASGGHFGESVAAVGTDRVLIADRTRAAFLFSTNGALLTTFTSPVPASGDYFGWSVAAAGTDQVLIGAYRDNTGAPDAGAAYLFSTDGLLLTTFTNPTAVASDLFGISVATVGTHRVLIGTPGDDTGASDAGAAYLFDIDGALLTTFTNPTPALGDHFGISVAAVGTDRVLIGADYDDTRAENAGAVYLFNTNGALLTTFTNPGPLASGDNFGFSVAAVGTNRVLIGALHDGTGATYAGSAYLFSDDGTLLTAFTNPTPANFEYFGICVAGVGTDRLLIGAPYDDTGATNAGVAYLFSPAAQSAEAPGLTIRFTTTNTVAVSWPSPSTGWTLQQSTNGVGSINWSNVTSGILDDSTNMAVIVNPPTGNRFYRLSKP